MDKEVFNTHGDFEPSFLERLFDDGWKIKIPQDNPGSFPVREFLSGCLGNLDEHDLASEKAWDLCKYLIPSPRLLELLTSWQKSLNEVSRKSLESSLQYTPFHKGAEGFLALEIPAIRTLRQQLLTEMLKKNRHGSKSNVSTWPHVQQAFLKILPLEADDVAMIGFAYLYNAVDEVEAFFDSWGNQKRGFMVARFLGISAQRFFSRLSSIGSLATLDILTTSVHSFMNLDDGWFQSLHSLSVDSMAREKICPDTGKEFDLGSFRVNPLDIDLLGRLLAGPGPLNILIHGKPGTGKSELARTLVKTAGLEPWALSVTAIQSRGKIEVSDVVMCRKLTEHHPRVLVVDEAEPFLASQSGFSFFSMPDESDNTGKAKINMLLDSSKGKAIWILNNIEGLDQSTRRRFQYILEMPKPNRESRLGFWQYYAAKANLTGPAWDTVWQGMSEEFEVVPALIGQTLQTVNLVSTDRNPVTIVPEVRRLLMAHVATGNGKFLGFQSAKNWRLDVLNASMDLPQLIEGIRLWLKKESFDRSGQRMLFHGEPGTGKTECAKQMAKLLDVELHVHRASDILSKWVGEAEKNIRLAFSQAEAAGALLVIDEIDTFLYSRERAKQSWELSQVNEFLTSLESYRGLFIGTTNGLDRLDPAVLRRFHHKVEFHYLKPEQANTLCAELFPGLAQETIADWAAMPPLAPGDFAAIAAQAETPKTWIDLKAALLAEAVLRKPVSRQIGFL